MQKRDSNNEKLLSNINEDEIVDLCSELIKIPSENPPGDMLKISDFIGNYLEENNIKFKTYEPKEGRIGILTSIGGEKPGKHLILNGHMDVVPVGNRSKWSFPPFSGNVKDGFVHGRGASDMKGGLASLLVAFKLLAEFGNILGKVTLMIVPDEETGGKWGTRWLVDNKIVDADACLIAEPSGRYHPTIGQKGACWLKITTTGSSAHGSLFPLEGENAILKMQKVIDIASSLWDRECKIPEEITEILSRSKSFVKKAKGNKDIGDILDHITVNVGTINGGDKVNKVAERCEMEVDIRTPFGVSFNEVVTYLKRKFDDQSVDAEIEYKGGGIDANYTDPEDTMVKLLLKNIKELTKEEPYATFQWASSDARYFRQKNIPTIQYGPAELEGIHSYDEKVRIDDLILTSKVYISTIIDYLAESSK